MGDLQRLKKFIYSRKTKTVKEAIEASETDSIDNYVNFYGTGTTKGNFLISFDELPKFLKLVSAASIEGLKTGLFPGLIEAHPDAKKTHTYMPMQKLAFDIDLSYDIKDEIDEETGQFWSTDDLKKLMSCIIYGLNCVKSKNSDIGVLEFDIMCRSGPDVIIDEMRQKNGIHVVLRGMLFTEATVLAIREFAIGKAVSDGIFSNAYGFNTDQFYDNLFDKCVITSNGWYVYGCSKENSQPYLTRYKALVPKNDDEALIQNIAAIKPMLSEVSSCLIFNTKTMEDMEDFPVDPSKMEEFDRTMHLTRETSRHKDQSEHVKKENNMTKEEFAVEFRNVKLLVSMIPSEWASINKKKISVGITLKYFSIINGLDEEDDLKLFEVWHEFCNLKPDRGDKREKDWNRWINEIKPRKNGLTYKSLDYWARTYSKKRYITEFIDKQVPKNLIEALAREPRTFEVSKFTVETFSQPVVCASSNGGGTWYVYREKDHIWKPAETDSIFSYFLSTKDDNGFESIFRRGLKEIYKEDDDALIQALASPTFKKLRANLGDVSYKNKIYRELKVFYENDELIDMFDKNFNVVAYKNGVLELDTGIFRDGVPDDNLTFRCEFEFVEFDIPLDCRISPREPGFGDWDGTVDNKIVDLIRYIEYYLKRDNMTKVRRAMTDYNIPEELVKVIQIFQEIIPDDETRHVLLDEWAREFAGKPNLRLFYHLGKGGNGKSLTALFKREMFGKRVGLLSGNTFTERRTSPNAPNPELMECHKATCGQMEEMESGEEARVRNATVKWYLSGSFAPVRQMYETTVPVRLYMNLHAFVNVIPPPEDVNDDAYWRRVVVVDYPSMFVYNPKDPKFTKMENVYVRDDSLMVKDNYDKLIPMLNFLITKYYYPKSRKEESFIPSAEMDKHTQIYSSRTSIFLNYRKERIQKDTSPNAHITVDQVYEDFRAWAAQNVSGRIPTKTALINALVPALGSFRRVKSKGAGSRLQWDSFCLLPVGTGNFDEDDFGIATVSSMDVTALDKSASTTGSNSGQDSDVETETTKLDDGLPDFML